MTTKNLPEPVSGNNILARTHLISVNMPASK